MQLMIAKSDSRVLNWGTPPWDGAPDDSLITIVDWVVALPATPKDYRLVNGSLVFDPLPPDPEIAATIVDRNNFDAAYDNAITDLTTLVNSGTQTFSTAQLSNFMRRNAQIWLKVLPLAKRLRDRDL